jgi:hypothetical protein
MSSEPGKENTEPDNVNVGLIATVTIVGALLVVSTAAALTALVRSESSAYSDTIGSKADLGSVERLKAQQHQKLEQPPAWADKATGKISVPIDRAKALLLADVQKNPYLISPVPPKPKEAPDAGAAPATSAAADGSAAPTGSAVPAPAESAAPTGSPAPAPGSPVHAPGSPAPAPAGSAAPAPAAPVSSPGAAPSGK